MKRSLISLLAGSLCLCIVLSFSACEGEPPPGPVGDNVNDYLNGLPTWTEFSPPRPDMDASPTGGPIVDEA